VDIFLAKLAAGDNAIKIGMRRKLRD